MNSHILPDLSWLDGLLIFLALVYLLQIFQFYRGLFRFQIGQNQQQFSVTVIVPARNEAQNITRCLKSLAQQSYPNYKILVVDDHSTDATAEIVQSFAAKNSRIKLLKLNEIAPCPSPKKRAITRAIATSHSEILATIDADCEAPRAWLANLIAAFEPTVGLVAGPVLFHEEKNLFEKLQALEFLGLVTAGAGSLGAGKPIIANGANLAYRRAAFEAVNGFDGIDHLSSGDDDLLMQKIAYGTDWQVRFVPRDAIVRTRPVSTLRQFLAQRIRWASKATIYDGLQIKFFLVATYLFYALLFASAPLSLGGKMAPGILLPVALAKMGMDWLVVRRGGELFLRNDLRKYFVLAEFLQIPYILYVGAMGTLGKVDWKGRSSRI
jgi:cellulose synthase/poly-beta-1,6-N-acetylglucosamine synthase-like glycosyltransferase